MPDTTPRDTDARHPHSDLLPPGSAKESRDTAERFADALDALVLDARAPEMHDAKERALGHLTTTAADIQRRHGTGVTANRAVSATPIGETRRRQIWEDLMARHVPDTSPALASTAQASMIERLGALMQPWVATDDERPARGLRASTGPRRFVPDPQPVMTFALVIAVLIAVGAGFSAIVAPGGPGVTPTASAEGLAGLNGQTGRATPESPAGQATSSAAVPTADPTDEFQRPLPIDDSTCAIEPRPLDEIAAFLRDPGPVTPRAYLPATTPNRATAEDVARAGRTYIACAFGPGTPVNTDRALQTPRFIYEQPANGYSRQSGGATDLATKEEREELARLVFGTDLQAGWILVSDLAISRSEYEAAGFGPPPSVPSQRTATPSMVPPEQVDSTFLPRQAVQLADGRIAVTETFLVNPADVDLWLSDDDTNPVFVTFYFFAPDATRDGRWGMDERLLVCLDSNFCEELYADLDPANDALFPIAATPAVSTDSTPSATPAAHGTARHGARSGARLLRA